MLDLLVAAIATGLALPMAMIFLRRRRIVDVPNERSLHVVPVHRGGGLACIVGALAGLVVAEARGEPVRWSLVGLVVVFGAVGAADDIHRLPAAPRLGAQAVLGGSIGWLVGHQFVWVVAGLIGLVITVNAVNFMDGINGITGLTVGVWGITAVVLGSMHDSHQLVPLGAVAAGAALGFLPANLPTARLFLGDIGSYFFGALIGLGILIGIRDGISPLAIAAPLSVYLADTGVTLARRALRRAPLLSAHRDHVYQRLVSDVGLSHTAAAVWAAAVAAATSACWGVGNPWLATSVSAVLLLAYLHSARIVSHVRDGGPPKIARIVVGLGSRTGR